MENTDLQQQLQELREDIEQIKERNKRVESDKAWEISKTRTIFITISTYMLIFSLMLLLKQPNAFWNALIASLGYLISTATYGALKKLWLKKRTK